MDQLKRITPTLLLISALFLYVQMFVRLPGLSGDASIYWTFAKSMWTQGFFHFGPSGHATHGATSPLWAFLLSFVYLARPDWYEGFQGLSIVFTGLTAVSTGLLARHLTKSTTGGLLAANFLLLSADLHRYSSAGYDTGIITFVFVETIRATVLLSESQTRGRWAHWAAAMAALPLARPEGAMFFPIIAAWTGYFVGVQKRSLGAFLGFGVLAGLPSLVFYLWMYGETGQLVPTSVRGRELVALAKDTYWPPVPVYSLVYRTLGGLLAPEGPLEAAFAVVWLGLVGLGAVVTFQARRPLALLFIACPLSLLAMMLSRNPSSYVVRYSLPVVAMGATFATAACYALAERQRRLPDKTRTPATAVAVVMGLVLASAPALTIYQRARLPKPTGIAQVLDIEGTATLNQFLTKDHVAIVYEIQSQYWLNCKTIAGDGGIVGGDLYTYLKTKEIQAFHDLGVTHIFVSNAFDYRSIFDRTVMEHLWEVDPKVEVGETVEYQGVRLKKLVARPEQPMKPHWVAVYEVERSG